MSAPRAMLGSVLYVGVLITLATGLALIAGGRWRVGATVCGGAMLAAGVGRLLIPERMAGLLRVRRRTTDAVLMLLLGTTLVALAVAVPPQP